MADSCVFCEIVADRANVKVIRQYDHSLIIVPLNPVTAGHVIVIPHEHVVDAADDPDITETVFHAAALYAKQIGGAFNLITSAGVEATQTVMHLHVHVVPRREGDGLALPWVF